MRRIAELETSRSELEAALKQAGGFPLPPAHLQHRVAAYSGPFFIEHGEMLLESLRLALSGVGRDLTSFREILDFGCGSARVLRALHYQGARSQNLFGTDLDEEAIDWCRANLSSVGHFSVNGEAPPMGYADHAFDLVFSVSVFTHLPEDMQLDWLEELRRVTTPGGYLLLTTFNEQSFDEVTGARLDTPIAGFYHDDRGPRTEGLPAFYRQSFHTKDYIRSRWSEFFDIVAIRERAIDDLQDIVVCRNRAP